MKKYLLLFHRISSSCSHTITYMNMYMCTIILVYMYTMIHVHVHAYMHNYYNFCITNTMQIITIVVGIQYDVFTDVLLINWYQGILLHCCLFNDSLLVAT